MQNQHIEWTHIDKGYTMKVRLCLNKEAANIVDSYFVGLEKAANMTLWELKNHNPEICQIDKEGTLWPNFAVMTKKTWIDQLREKSSAVAAVPCDAIASSVGGLFLSDMKKGWEKQGKLPVDAWFAKKNSKGKPALRFYGKGKTKDSYFLQLTAGKFEQDEQGRVYVNLSKALGRARIRGWYENITFGENGVSFFEYYKENKDKKLSCRISKNNIGEYYLTIILQDVNRRFKVADDRQPVGIDVNVSEDTGVVSSRNVFYKNKKFKKSVQDLEDELHRRISRRYGVSNEKFREECKAVRRSNKNKAYEERTPLPLPSKRYQKADLALKKLSLKVQRQRDYYQHEISAAEVGASSLVGIESLNVSGMMKNNNLSYSLADAAMSSQLNKISYKCKWANVPIMQVGQWFPSSHKCPDCGHLFDGDEKFGLEVREWTCPECGATWNRDLAAAENIKQEALQIQAHPELYVEEPKETDKNKSKNKTKPDRVLDKEHPDILIRYDSKMKENYKNPWIVVDLNGNVLDDAQGYGFDTAQKAQKCYRHKIKQKIA